MPVVNPYINFNGNCEEAFNFYQSAFGTKLDVMRFKDVPPEAKQNMSSSEDNKVMHCQLEIGKGTVLMGSDIPEHFGKAKIGENYFISVNADSEQEAKKLFDKLSSGGKVTMPMGNTFWGAYFGMFADKFGIQWMVSYTYPQN